MSPSTATGTRWVSAWAVNKIRIWVEVNLEWDLAVGLVRGVAIYMNAERHWVTRRPPRVASWLSKDGVIQFDYRRVGYTVTDVL